MEHRSHHLFFVYGASGSGKSTILNMAEGISSHITIHRKDSTRPSRPKENETGGINDIHCVEKMNPSDYILQYEQWGHTYGIRKDQLTSSFENLELHFIIIGNIKTLREMKQLYPYAVSLYIHYDPEDIPKSFLERDTLEYRERKKKIKTQYSDYVKNNTLFDHVIVNFWDLKNARAQLKNIIQRYVGKFDYDLLDKQKTAK